MRWNGVLISIALAAAFLGAAGPSAAATFGTVVPIGGHASDIALDESRGLLYIANFTANRIEVMSTADLSIRSSMNVAPQPGALSISPDGQFLLVAHFGNFSTADTSRNAITLINLNDNTRQTFTMGDVPLALTFVADGTALIFTTTSVLLFDPVTGAMNVIDTYAAIGKTLPADPATFPTQMILAEAATNPDRTVAYAVADDSKYQVILRYDTRKGQLTGMNFVASPKPLPHLAVPADGSWILTGTYKWDPRTYVVLNQIPNAVASTNIGANALDSRAGILYSQFLTPNTSATSSSSSSSTSTTTPAAQYGPPVLSIMDADNFTVRETLLLPENMTGRAVLNGSADVLYSASDSGVLVLPVGRLKQYHRVAASASDIVATNTSCNRSIISKTLTITDPGGGSTDFTIGASAAGVSISPSSGITPATVQVRVDPNAFQNSTGTVTVPLTITSSTAVNVAPSVRLLINNHNPDQRGTAVNIPGVITDILPDPARNRFYVVQQDRNMVLVYDGTSYKQLAALRSGTTPTRLAITFDRQYLVIGHDNTQQAYVYDLDTFQQQTPITFPSGHYPRSIAESGNGMLALVRNVSGGNPGEIDRIDFAARKASGMPSLGVYSNKVSQDGILVPSPNGAAILAAMPDGNLMLYDANAGTFTVSRKDSTGLQGSVAASSYNTYVVGNQLLNSSLVPQATLESSSGKSSGFAFVDSWGFRTTTPGDTAPGVIQRVDPAQSLGIKPTRMVEAPLAPSTAVPFTRTLAPLYDRSSVVALTISGFTVLPWNYDAAVAPPKITSVVNLADGTAPVAPGGLISVIGQQMSPVNIATQQVPLPTALGESCLTVNGIPVPMTFVSSKQINGQLPFNVDGAATMTLRTPGGVSDNFYFTIYAAAPSIFRSGSAGPMTGLATVVRSDNGEFVTPTNPLHPGDSIVIYATGLGRTDPPVDAGLPAPSDPLSSSIIAPAVTLGGAPLQIDYAGLAPGQVGVYQINARVSLNAPQGLSVPLVVDQGGLSTRLDVRVVK
jgi:uncharacterized protein (TIGR03437 family)